MVLMPIYYEGTLNRIEIDDITNDRYYCNVLERV